MDRRTFLGTSAAALLLAQRPDASTQSLAQIAASRGIRFGSAIDYPDRRITGDPRVAAIYMRECSDFVFGHQLIWGQRQRSRNARFDFSAADRIATFAARGGKRMNGHAAIWHNFLPAWVHSSVTSANAEEIIRAHVRNLVGRYRGRMGYWTVVNEPFDWQRRRKDGLIPSPFSESLGAEFIDIAFDEAARADPGARLVLNEVGMEHNYPDAARKRAMALTTAKRLKKRGIPIHAIGVQAHLRPDFPFSKSKWRSFVKKVGRLGLRLYITEMDVEDRSLPSDIAARDRAVGKTMADFLDATLSGKTCDTVMMWGLMNRLNWLNLPEQPRPQMDKWDLRLPRRDGLPHRPTLFDDANQPTAAYAAVAEALARARRR